MLEPFTSNFLTYSQFRHPESPHLDLGISTGDRNGSHQYWKSQHQKAPSVSTQRGKENSTASFYSHPSLLLSPKPGHFHCPFPLIITKYFLLHFLRQVITSYKNHVKVDTTILSLHFYLVFGLAEILLCDPTAVSATHTDYLAPRVCSSCLLRIWRHRSLLLALRSDLKYLYQA